MSIALILSGGGARGAYEVGVMSYVFGDLLPKTKAITAISGTSVGAVNGAFTGSALHDLRGGMIALEELWSGLELDDVLGFSMRQMTGLHRLIVGGGSTPAGFFDASPLRALVGERLRWNSLRRNLKSGTLRFLTISTTNIRHGYPVIFIDRGSGAISLPVGFPDEVKVRPAKIMPRHVLASASIPIAFPPVAIGSELYCDGGLRLNTPMSPAIHLGYHKLFVIGISSKKRHEAGPVSGTPGATFLLGKVLNAFLIDHLEADLAELHKTNQMLELGELTYGEDFISELNMVAQRNGYPPKRKIDALVVRPSVDIGELAADHLRSNRVRFRKSVGQAFMRMLDVGSRDADLASYLMFDGSFARRLIDLGRKDAHEQRDEIASFFTNQ